VSLAAGLERPDHSIYLRLASAQRRLCSDLRAVPCRAVAEQVAEQAAHALALAASRQEAAQSVEEAKLELGERATISCSCGPGWAPTLAGHPYGTAVACAVACV
jgi:hypothetical protein